MLYQNQCHSIVPNCQNQQGSICKNCNINFVEFDNLCFVVIPNCASQSGSTCSACTSAFVLTSNTCYSKIINCETQIASTCSACAANCILTNNACYTQIQNCASQSGSICSSCNSGFIILNNNCVVDLNILHCSVYSNGNCNLCNSGYIVNNGACWPVYCVSYNTSTGVCASCSAFAQMNNGLCYFIESCLTYNFGTSPVSCSACRSMYALKYSQLFCLGSAHFLIKSTLNVQSNPAIGYFAQTGTSPAFNLMWGSFKLGTSNSIWYTTRYSSLNLYSIKMVLSVNSVRTAFYLASDGVTPYLTTSMNIDNTTFWIMAVQNVNGVNLWSIRSPITGNYLEEGMSMSSTGGYFNFI